MKKSKIFVGVLVLVLLGGIVLVGRGDLFTGRFMLKRVQPCPVGWDRIYVLVDKTEKLPPQYVTINTSPVTSPVSSMMVSQVPSMVASRGGVSQVTSPVASVVTSPVTSPVASGIPMDKRLVARCIPRGTPKVPRLEPPVLKNFEVLDYQANPERFKLSQQQKVEFYSKFDASAKPLMPNNYIESNIYRYAAPQMTETLEMAKPLEMLQPSAGSRFLRFR